MTNSEISLPNGRRIPAGVLPEEPPVVHDFFVNFADGLLQLHAIRTAVSIDNASRAGDAVTDVEVVSSMALQPDVVRYLRDSLTTILEAEEVRPTSRNAPCSCGSGRKYKHCHGRPSGV